MLALLFIPVLHEVLVGCVYICNCSMQYLGDRPRFVVEPFVIPCPPEEPAFPVQ
jgi:hypothetical protein